MSCQKGLLYNLPLESAVPGIWPVEETQPRKAIYHKYFVLQVGDFQGIPYPDNFFDFVLITGTLPVQFSLIRVFEEIDRVLKPQGELCFSLSPEQLEARSGDRSGATGLEKSMIYYGMESGFIFIPSTSHPREGGKSRKGYGTTLYLTLNENAPNHKKKITFKRTEDTAIWFCKA